MQEAVGEILEQVLGGELVADGADEITADGRPVMIQQLMLGRFHFVARGAVRPADQRPACRDPAQTRVQSVGTHTHDSR